MIEDQTDQEIKGCTLCSIQVDETTDVSTKELSIVICLDGNDEAIERFLNFYNISKIFELYVFDVTKIKDSDITDGSKVRAIVTALKMQGNSISERWSPKRGMGAYYMLVVRLLCTHCNTA